MWTTLLLVLGGLLAAFLLGLALTQAGRGVWQIALRGLFEQRLVCAVVVFTVALSAGLVMTVYAMHAQSRQAFLVSNAGFDAVLGPRSSELQLVLNAIYHLEDSPGNLSWQIYRELAEATDRAGKPVVTRAVPYALGDNYRGYRVIGTTRERFYPIPGRENESGLPLAEGRYFDEGTGPDGEEADGDGVPRREAVVGAHVARSLGLELGSTFRPYHGLEFDPTTQHSEEYLVVGILAATNRPDDRVLFIPIEGIFRMEGHALFGAGEQYVPQPGVEIPEEHKEVSAVLIAFAQPRYGLEWSRRVNVLGDRATLAWPVASVMNRFFQRIGWVLDVLGLVALLVVFVAAAGILSSLYATMQRRLRQIAVLRALGVRRRSVFASVVLESTLIGAAGGVLGWLVYLGLLAVAGGVLRAETGVVIEMWHVHEVLWMTPVGVTVLAALVGLLPAWHAYRVDVARTLQATTY